MHLVLLHDNLNMVSCENWNGLSRFSRVLPGMDLGCGLALWAVRWPSFTAWLLNGLGLGLHMFSKSSPAWHGRILQMSSPSPDLGPMGCMGYLSAHQLNGQGLGKLRLGSTQPMDTPYYSSTSIHHCAKKNGNERAIFFFSLFPLYSRALNKLNR